MTLATPITSILHGIHELLGLATTGVVEAVFDDAGRASSDASEDSDPVGHARRELV